MDLFISIAFIEELRLEIGHFQKPFTKAYELKTIYKNSMVFRSFTQFNIFRET